MSAAGVSISPIGKWEKGHICPWILITPHTLLTLDRGVQEKDPLFTDWERKARCTSAR